jgi:hypothetical protein
VAAALDLSGAREAGSGSVAPRLSFSGLYILQRLASEGTATGVVLFKLHRKCEGEESDGVLRAKFRVVRSVTILTTTSS